MKSIYEIRDCKEDIMRSRIHADRLVNELRKWDKKEFGEHSPEYLRKLNEELQELKSVLLKNPIDIRVWDGVSKISTRIKDYIEKESQ